MFFLKAGSTLPPPFNILPTVKSFLNLLKRLRGKGKKNSDKYKGKWKILEVKQSSPSNFESFETFFGSDRSSRSHNALPSV